jgi:hypothetical protein
MNIQQPTRYVLGTSLNTESADPTVLAILLLRADAVIP